MYWLNIGLIWLSLAWWIDSYQFVFISNRFLKQPFFSAWHDDSWLTISATVCESSVIHHLGSGIFGIQPGFLANVVVWNWAQTRCNILLSWRVTRAGLSTGCLDSRVCSRRISPDTRLIHPSWFDFDVLKVCISSIGGNRAGTHLWCDTTCNIKHT